jgi:hypothetical protein
MSAIGAADGKLCRIYVGRGLSVCTDTLAQETLRGS